MRRAASRVQRPRKQTGSQSNDGAVLVGERDENELRKDFTPSERVEIGKRVEEDLGERQGQRTDRELVENFPQVEPGTKTRDIAAARAGFGNAKTFQQAKQVVDKGAPELVEAMDRDAARYDGCEVGKS